MEVKQNLPNDHWRVFPQYNAEDWYSDFDYKLNWKENAQPHIKLLWEYFDANIESLRKLEQAEFLPQDSENL